MQVGWVEIGDVRQITGYISTRSSAIAEGPRDASCQLKSCRTLMAMIGESVVSLHHKVHKKLSYRRGTVRCVVSIEILPIAPQQCRNYLYDNS